MPHTAKLCFCVTLMHFWENSLKNSLFSQKVTMSERSIEILRNFIFFNKFEKGQIQRKIWICLNNFFFDQTSKRGQIFNTNFFSPQNEPHTVKLCFSVVLKHFWGNSLKSSLFSQKSDCSEILRKFVFLNMFEKG